MIHSHEDSEDQRCAEHDLLRKNVDDNVGHADADHRDNQGAIIVRPMLPMPPVIAVPDNEGGHTRKQKLIGKVWAAARQAAASTIPESAANAPQSPKPTHSCAGPPRFPRRGAPARRPRSPPVASKPRERCASTPPIATMIAIKITFGDAEEPSAGDPTIVHVPRRKRDGAPALHQEGQPRHHNRGSERRDKKECAVHVNKSDT